MHADVTILLVERLGVWGIGELKPRATLEEVTEDSLMTLGIEIEAEPIPLVVDQSGTVRVCGSRVTLDTIVYAFREGATPEEIAQQYPTLSLVDVYAVITFYLRHEADVQTYLDRREREAERVRRDVEARQGHTDLRARLLARRANRSSTAHDPSGE